MQGFLYESLCFLFYIIGILRNESSIRRVIESWLCCNIFRYKRIEREAILFVSSHRRTPFLESVVRKEKK